MPLLPFFDADGVAPGDAALNVTSPGHGVSEMARVTSSTARRTLALTGLALLLGGVGRHVAEQSRRR